MSRLLDEYMVECTFLNKQVLPDGYGGTKTTYTKGATFNAAIYMPNSVEVKTAEQQGVKGLYSVVVDKSTRLEYHDVFERSDGTVFRVTSKDEQATPGSTNLNLRVVSAEEWVIPNG